MSRAFCAFLLFAAICTLLLSAATFRLTYETYQQQTTDNQSLKALHEAYTAVKAEKAKLQQDLHDTEEALDKAALEGSRLGEENWQLQLKLDRQEKAHSL